MGGYMTASVIPESGRDNSRLMLSAAKCMNLDIVKHDKTRSKWIRPATNGALD